MKIIAEFNECPDCKVDDRLVKTICEKEIELGNLSENFAPYSSANIYAPVDATRKPLLVGGRLLAARVLRDVCIKCGKEFTTRIEMGHVTPSADPRLPPTFA